MMTRTKKSSSDTRCLQVNTAGAWKDVVRFGQGGDDAERVKHAAKTLWEVSPTTNWRLVSTQQSPPKVLAHLGENTYGLWVARDATGETEGV